MINRARCSDVPLISPPAACSWTGVGILVPSGSVKHLEFQMLTEEEEEEEGLCVET